MIDTSRLVRMRICNLGCIGPEGCEVALDKVLCLVGGNNTGKSTILCAYELVLGTASFDPEKDLCRGVIIMMPTRQTILIWFVFVLPGINQKTGFRKANNPDLEFRNHIYKVSASLRGSRLSSTRFYQSSRL